jgi:hypothetical protein
VFLEGVDGRSVLARRYRDILEQLISDIGGDPSEAQSLILRRSATLAVWCEMAEAEMAQGKELDIVSFTTATNALRRLLADIGLQRRSRDVTPDPLVNGSEAINVEHTHQVVEQADQFISKLMDLAAKRGRETVDGDTSVPNREDAE